MSSINGTDTILHKARCHVNVIWETYVLERLGHRNRVSNLEIWVPSATVQDFGWNESSWWLDRLPPKFPDCIQDLMEVSADCLNRPYKGPLDTPKPLVMAYDMKEHCNLFLNVALEAIPKQSP